MDSYIEPDGGYNGLCYHQVHSHDKQLHMFFWLDLPVMLVRVSTQHGDASDNSHGPGCDVDACAPVEHSDLSDTSVGPIMNVDACGEFMLDPIIPKLNNR